MCLPTHWQLARRHTASHANRQAFVEPSTAIPLHDRIYVPQSANFATALSRLVPIADIMAADLTAVLAARDAALVEVSSLQRQLRAAQADGRATLQQELANVQQVTEPTSFSALTTTVDIAALMATNSTIQPW